MLPRVIALVMRIAGPYWNMSTIFKYMSYYSSYVSWTFEITITKNTCNEMCFKMYKKDMIESAETSQNYTTCGD